MTEKRHCFKCKQPMITQMVEEVEVDYCPECGGLWLDKDELLQLAETSEEAVAELRALLHEERGGKGAASDIEPPCLACGGKLTVAKFGTLYLEFCMTCEGIYIDRTELERAIGMIKTRDGVWATIVALAQSVITSGSIED